MGASRGLGKALAEEVLRQPGTIVFDVNVVAPATLMNTFAECLQHHSVMKWLQQPAAPTEK